MSKETHLQGIGTGRKFWAMVQASGGALRICHSTVEDELVIKEIGELNVLGAERVLV